MVSRKQKVPPANNSAREERNAQKVFSSMRIFLRLPLRWIANFNRNLSCEKKARGTISFIPYSSGSEMKLHQ